MLLLYALSVLACLAPTTEGDGKSAYDIKDTQHWSVSLRVGHSKCKPASVRLAVFSDPDRCLAGGRASVQVLVEDENTSLQPRPGYSPVYGMGFYKLHTKPTSWNEAKLICEDEDAHLAIINSEAEALVLAKLIERSQVPENWILVGFHDRNKEGMYETVFGDPIASTGYTTWHKGQPDNKYNNDNCGTIHRTGGLNDFPCDLPAPFFCEQEQ